ncbi:MAG: hypothetical protein KIS73_05090 [Enhydrobacter sp.]|nr:hypothetical protein [Enhydrobacter sp.]
MSKPDDDPPPIPSLPAFAHRLRNVAAEVRHIGYGKAARSPEAAMMQKDEIAAKIERLAAILERGAS